MAEKRDRPCPLVENRGSEQALAEQRDPDGPCGAPHRLEGGWPLRPSDDPPRVDVDRIEAACRELLAAIGENVDREGLRDTPRRWAGWWREFIEYDAGWVETTFESVESDQMVVVSGLRVWSLCEHHLLPFWSDVTIGYITADRILGLSKFGRIAQQMAHRLQVQERLVQQIADQVIQIVGSDDVAVLARGQHLCMTMRGVRMPSLMTSSVMRGQFRENHRTRMEFLHLAGWGVRDVP